MLPFASTFLAFAAVACLSILDKRQWQKWQAEQTLLGHTGLVRAGWLFVAVSAALPFLEPSYSAWMALIGYGGILTVAALAYAVVAAFNMQLAIRIVCAALLAAAVIIGLRTVLP